MVMRMNGMKPRTSWANSGCRSMGYVLVTLCLMANTAVSVLHAGGSRTEAERSSRAPRVTPLGPEKQQQGRRFEEKWKRGQLPAAMQALVRRDKLNERHGPERGKPWSHLINKRPAIDRDAARAAGISESIVDSVLAAWVVHYSSGLAPSLDAASAITLDASGNVYVAGYTTGIFSGYDAVTIKYNSAGVQQWIASYNGPGNDYDGANAIVVDASGNVYVTGSSFGIDTDEDVLTIKYSASGVGQWVARYDGPANDYDAGLGLKVDNAGNVHVTGTSYGVLTDADIVTIKYNAAGTELWYGRYDGGVNDLDIPAGLGIDISGSVYVSGTSYGEETLEDFVTIKYSFLGSQVWVRRYDGPGNDYDAVAAMTVDVGGNTYVTGASYNTNFDADYATIKYDAFGGTDWSVRYNSPEESDELPAAITIDGSRNVYITGTSYALLSGDDYLTVKYSSSGGIRWVATYDGPGSSFDAAASVFVDAGGNVYVTGSSTGSGTFEDYATVKYNSLGLQSWVARYTGDITDYDAGAAVTVDGFGNVYVAGTSYGLVTDEDIATVKYSSVGVQQWATRYNGPGNSADEAAAVALDPSGNIYVTGTSFDQKSQSDYATVKYNSAGVPQWVARYNGTGDAEDFVSAIVIDNFGNAYVTGTSFGVSTGYDIATVKYNVNGAQIWAVRYASGGSAIDQGTDIAVDGSGNVYVTGARFDPASGNDFLTIKYQTTGTQLWAGSYNGPGDSTDNALDLALDAGGNVYVTGTSVGAGGTSDFATVKYNTSGTQQWVSRYSGPANGVDQAYAIAVDATNNVFVTGASEGIGTGFDYATIRYNSSGVQQWAVRYSGSGNASDVPTMLKLDASSNVFVTGGSQATGMGYDFLTIKYNSSGVQQWNVRYNSGENDDDIGADVALDSKGNVYVTGYSFLFKSGYDYATVRYSPAGVQQWVTRYDDPAQLNDEPQGIVVDALGNVYVAGYSETEDGSVYSVIKYEAPRFGTNSNMLTFGSIAVGCRLVDTVIVRNLAQVNALNVTAVTNNANYTVVPPTFSVNANDSFKLAVIYAPLNPGLASGKVYFTHNGITSVDSMNLSGTGTGTGGAIRIQANLGSSWRLYSLPVNVLCPYIIPFSYSFQNQYFRSDTLSNGRGYWTKLTNPVLNFTGYPYSADTIAVTAGWNLIGSLSVPVSVASVSSSPDSIIRTSFFGYGGSYYATDSLKPALGYWVKISQSGVLFANQSSGPASRPGPASPPAANSLILEDAEGRTQSLLYGRNPEGRFTSESYELPPLPPDGAFDIRYESNTMMEFAGADHKETTLKISAATFPISLRWGEQEHPMAAWLVVGNRVISLLHEGEVLVEYPQSISLRLQGIEDSPIAFSLDQNYPNPFNPVTTVRYGIPIDGNATLRVYDILGRLIRTLVKREVSKGTYTVEWDGTNDNNNAVASGLYFYRLDLVPDGGVGITLSESRKMLLLR